MSFLLTKALKKLYKDDNDAYCEACKRHTEFFNCTSQVCSFPVGVVLAMEEKNANSKEKNLGPAISAVKSALMGPMSAIGDTFFWGCFRVISASVGATLCMDGNILGPIVFVILFNIPNIATHWFGVTLGYKLGDNFMNILRTGWTVSETYRCSVYFGTYSSRCDDSRIYQYDIWSAGNNRRICCGIAERI